MGRLDFIAAVLTMFFAGSASANESDHAERISLDKAPTTQVAVCPLPLTNCQTPSLDPQRSPEPVIILVEQQEEEVRIRMPDLDYADPMFVRQWSRVFN